MIPEFIVGQDCVIYDQPDSQYRSAPGVSNSMLKHLALDGEEPGSPAHFLQSFSDPKKETDALVFGRMVHSRILTPNEPLPGVIAIPETYPPDGKPWHSGAKYCKDWKAQQEAAGLYPMSQSALDDMNGVVNAIAEHPNCKVIFSEGRPEVSCFKRWRGSVLRKARIDWVPTESALCDIKTCMDARICDFDSVIFKRRYYVQAAYYLDIWNELNPHDIKNNFIFIVVEKFAPFAMQVFYLPQEDIAEGRAEYVSNLSLLKECLAENKWPAYPDGVHEIKMRVPYGKGRRILR